MWHSKNIKRLLKATFTLIAFCELNFLNFSAYHSYPNINIMISYQ